MSKEITCGSCTGVAGTQGLSWWQEAVVSGSNLEKTPMAPCRRQSTRLQAVGCTLQPKRKGTMKRRMFSIKDFPD